jgi:hypothetical protein
MYGPFSGAHYDEDCANLVGLKPCEARNYAPVGRFVVIFWGQPDGWVS